MKYGGLKYIFIRILVLLVFINIFIILYTKSIIVISLILIFTILVFTLDLQKSFLLAASITIPLILLEVIFRLGGVNLHYYRPHEKLSLSAKHRYLPNAAVIMTSSHGDMLAIDPSASDIKEEREVKFITDNLGYRNNKKFLDQKIIIVGDSFIVGNGTSQANILPSILESEFNINVYNISFPGGPNHYLNRIETFPHSLSDRCIFVFLFEGNDFPNSIEIPQQGIIKSKIIFLINNYRFRFEIGRLFYSLYVRAFMPVNVKKADTILTHIVGKKKVGFLEKYNKATSRESYRPEEKVVQAFEKLINKSDVVFFIPDKLRVYFEYIKDSKSKEMPNKNWEFLESLSENKDVLLINLTKPFIRETGKLLENDQYLYWRDDTHWNGNGMRLTSRIISDLVAPKKLPCLK